MSKYLHYFETYEDYEKVRNSSDYIEPWVSYTKYRGGDVLKFVGDYTLEGTTTENLEFSYGGKMNGAYGFLSNADDSTVTAIGTDTQTGEVSSVTVNGQVISLAQIFEDGNCYWETGTNACVTASRNPKPGDNCLYIDYNDGPHFITIDTRNPETGVTYQDVIQGAMVLVKSISEQGEGKMVNTVNYNKEQPGGTTFEAYIKVLDEQQLASSATYYDTMSYEDFYELCIIAMQGQPQPQKGVQIFVYDESGTETDSGVFAWNSSTIELTHKEQVDLIQENLSRPFLNTDTGKLNPYYEGSTLKIHKTSLI